MAKKKRKAERDLLKREKALKKIQARPTRSYPSLCNRDPFDLLAVSSRRRHQPSLCRSRAAHLLCHARALRPLCSVASFAHISHSLCSLGWLTGQMAAEAKAEAIRIEKEQKERTRR